MSEKVSIQGALWLDAELGYVGFKSTYSTLCLGHFQVVNQGVIFSSPFPSIMVLCGAFPCY